MAPLLFTFDGFAPVGRTGLIVTKEARRSWPQAFYYKHGAFYPHEPVDFVDFHGVQSVCGP
jgi:hypothetical protein